MINLESCPYPVPYPPGIRSGVLTPEIVHRVISGHDFSGASSSVLCSLYQTEILLQGESPRPFRCAPRHDD